MQKAIIIADNDTKTLDTYLSNGWRVKQMIACRIDSRINYFGRYVLIEIE